MACEKCRWIDWVISKLDNESNALLDLTVWITSQADRVTDSLSYSNDALSTKQK